MADPTPTIPEAFNRFYEFDEHSAQEYADFQPVSNPDKALKNLLGTARYTNDFYVIGRHGTGSIIAFWQYPQVASLAEAPIVWLSSEGFPNSVFANSFEEFLTLIPYDTGFIYDMLASYYFNRQNPQSHISPREKFSSSELKTYLDESAERYEGHKAFLLWLYQVMQLKPTADPVSIIEAAIAAHPDLSLWLQNNGK